MSILHFDSFDGDGHAIGKYTTFSGANDFVSARNGTGLRLDGNSTQLLRVDFSANPTMFIGFTFRREQATTSTTDNIEFREGSTIHISVNWEAILKQILVERGTSAFLGRTPIGSFQLNTDHHFEMKVFVHDTTGTIEIRIDGTEVLMLTSQDTRNGGAVGTIDNIQMGGQSGAYIIIDNLVISDDQGGINDGFLGDVVIEARVPDGNGNYSQWDGSDGNQVDNYLQVDEGRPHDGDTTYNNAQVALEKDTYAVEDLVATSGSVLAVQAGMIARHEGAGGTLRHMLRRSSTDQFGSAVTPGSGYTYHLELWEQDPNAGPGAWTITNVDATEFGFELVS